MFLIIPFLTWVFLVAALSRYEGSEARTYLPLRRQLDAGRPAVETLDPK